MVSMEELGMLWILVYMMIMCVCVYSKEDSVCRLAALAPEGPQILAFIGGHQVASFSTCTTHQHTFSHMREFIQHTPPLPFVTETTAQQVLP